MLSEEDRAIAAVKMYRKVREFHNIGHVVFEILERRHKARHTHTHRHADSNTWHNSCYRATRLSNEVMKRFKQTGGLLRWTT